MNIKKYSGASMREALNKVKDDLGPDAVILQTRTFKAGTFLGMGGREVVEISAARDSEPVKRVRPAATYTRRGMADEADPTDPTDAVAVTEREKQALGFEPKAQLPPTPSPDNGPEPMLQAAEPPAQPPVEAAANRIRQPLENLENEMIVVKTMVQGLLGKDRNRTIADLPFALMKWYHQLLEGGLEEITARSLVVRLHRDMEAAQSRDPERVTHKLRESIAGLVRVSGPIRRTEGMPRRVALIGPTGVGKTTTIAKLAANFKLRDRLDVGLVTIDTYRIAAVEQLKVYADIIGVPLNVVLSPTELPGAMTAFADKDVVLIDTAGRSQMDDAKMTELRTFLEAAPPHETHLVISASTHPRNVATIVERFGPLASDKMIVTKLDEVMQAGSLLNLITKSQKAISYVTTGQEVPDDFEVARVDAVVERILGAVTW